MISRSTITLPQGRQGRLLALGCTLLGLLALWLGVLSPLWGFYNDQATTLSDEQARLARMQALVDRTPFLMRELDHARGSGHAADLTLPGPRDANAAAALQQMVMSMAQAHAIELASVTILRADAAGDARRIAVRVAFSAHWPEFVAFLRDLDAATPTLIPDDLSIQTQSNSDMLDIGLTIQGFRLAEPSAPQTGAAP